MIHRIIALMFLATSINGVSAMNEISEDTSSHTSDVSSISSNNDLGSVDSASDNKLSPSREISPTRERYGIYVVDKSYKSLTKDAISDKENFASIEIPLSVENIADDTFVECKNLRVVTIPVKYYHKLMPAFVTIKDQIKQIHIVGCNDKKHVDRIIKLSKQYYGFEKNKILVDIKGEYTADESTPGASCQIPISCEDYEKIVIKGKHLRNIENDTFITLPNVKHITLPKGITQIQFGAFDQCHKLESITLSNAAHTLNKMMLEHKGFTIQSDKHGYVTVKKSLLADNNDITENSDVINDKLNNLIRATINKRINARSADSKSTSPRSKSTSSSDSDN